METLTRFIIWIVCILGFAAGAAYLTVVDVWTIPSDDPLVGPSLAPNLEAGDRVLVMRGGDPPLPSIVRCTDPQVPQRYVVARYVGEAGDSVRIEGENVFVGTRRSPSPRRCRPPSVDVKAPVTGEVKSLECHEEEFSGANFNILRVTEGAEGPVAATVEPGRAFLVSDDRHFHLDSRDYGTVDKSSCHRILMRLWSQAGFSDAEHRMTWVW